PPTARDGRGGAAPTGVEPAAPRAGGDGQSGGTGLRAGGHRDLEWAIRTDGELLAGAVRDERAGSVGRCATRRATAPREPDLPGGAGGGGEHPASRARAGVRRVDLRAVERLSGGADRYSSESRLAAGALSPT